jgi:hypothetical protein
MNFASIGDISSTEVRLMFGARVGTFPLKLLQRNMAGLDTAVSTGAKHESDLRRREGDCPRGLERV